MSQQLISHSPDLKKLRDEGYEIKLDSGYLVVTNIPYLTADKQIKKGTLISELTLAGDKTVKPADHRIFFNGEFPCTKEGMIIHQIKNVSEDKVLAPGLFAKHTFSNKPQAGYVDYYEKIKTYIEIISAPARSIDPSVTAQTFAIVATENDQDVFNYFDTNSSRAGIGIIADKLRHYKVAIVGLGGTGAYILDQVSKNPVKEIHLFDGDLFLQHNAYRAPGAASIDELSAKLPKVEYYKKQYSKMHKKIYAYYAYIDDSNVSMLFEMDFVFICVDKGSTKKIIMEKLQEKNISFIDVGMGVNISKDNKLYGVVRVTASTDKKNDHISRRVSFDDGQNDAYTTNIQIAELNMLNAAFAVIKWKKVAGFFQDYLGEHHSTYTIDGHSLSGEEEVNEASIC